MNALLALRQASIQVFGTTCDHKNLDGVSLVEEYVDPETGYLMGECPICGRTVITICQHIHGTHEVERYTLATATEPEDRWIEDRCDDCGSLVESNWPTCVDDLPY